MGYAHTLSRQHAATVFFCADPVIFCDDDGWLLGKQNQHLPLFRAVTNTASVWRDPLYLDSHRNLHLGNFTRTHSIGGSTSSDSRTWLCVVDVAGQLAEEDLVMLAFTHVAAGCASSLLVAEYLHAGPVQTILIVAGGIIGSH